MEAGDLLDSVKFSDGVKKALRAGSHCRKKEARKTEIFLTLKKE